MRDVKEKVYENCEAFTKLKRSPESYVVGFQIGKVFNDVVALDVGGEKFIGMMNFGTQGSWIRNKTPQTFLERWLGIFRLSKKI